MLIRSKSNKRLKKSSGVKVEQVNTQNLKGKFKRQGRYGGYRPDRKKAVVTLSEDSKEIDFFEGV